MAGYRMSALLEQRQRALEEAEAQLAQERETVKRQETSCQAARARLRQARDRLTEQRSEARATVEAPHRTAQWVQERHYQQRLVGAVSARLDEVRAAEVRLSEAHHTELEARQSLLSARRELEVLKRDRERFEAEQRRAAERRVEREVDGLGAARYGRR